MCIAPKLKKPAKNDITAGELYNLCLAAPVPVGGWFSLVDTGSRLLLTIGTFYRFLILEPFSLLYFAWGWNLLWCAARLVFSGCVGLHALYSLVAWGCTPCILLWCAARHRRAQSALSPRANLLKL